LRPQFDGVFSLFKPVRIVHDQAMGVLRRLRRLADEYRFPGFRPLPVVVGIFGNPAARVVTLVRRSKKLDRQSRLEQALFEVS
jgi:hypothetical protein